MKDFSKNHRKGRCKTPQTKWIPVNPFELFRDKHLNNSDSKVRVLTNPEIEDFRNKGYSVDIVDRILPKCTRGYPYKGSGMSIKVVRELNKKSRKQELLERHVVVIRKIGELMKEVDDLGKEIHAMQDDEMPKSVFNLFKPFVDEAKLAECFYCIFQKFFGAAPCVSLKGRCRKPIDLIAYFFILVEWENLGNSIFSEKCKKPFFEYISENIVVGQIGKTERTFYNRITREMDGFRKKLLSEPVSSAFNGEHWKTNEFFIDFLKVIKIFHETEFYKELKKLKLA